MRFVVLVRVVVWWVLFCFVIVFWFVVGVMTCVVVFVGGFGVWLGCCFLLCGFCVWAVLLLCCVGFFGFFL